ncbi:hypothetical protein H0H81_012567, partial [Sphagnurus paluster]
MREPRSYVSIAIGSGPAQVTPVAKGIHPVWNQVLKFESHSVNPILSVEVIGVSRFFGKKVIAKQNIQVPSNEGKIEGVYDLQPSNKQIKLHLEWKIVTNDSEISGEVHVPHVATAAATSTPAAIIDTQTTSSPGHGLAGINQLVIDLHPEVGSDGDVETPHVNGRLSKVMGYVKFLVENGEKIAEIHPFANAAFKVLIAGQK